MSVTSINVRSCCLMWLNVVLIPSLSNPTSSRYAYSNNVVIDTIQQYCLQYKCAPQNTATILAALFHTNMYLARMIVTQLPKWNNAIIPLWNSLLTFDCHSMYIWKCLTTLSLWARRWRILSQFCATICGSLWD